MVKKEKRKIKVMEIDELEAMEEIEKWEKKFYSKKGLKESLKGYG